MSTKAPIIQKLEDMTLPVLADHKMELVDLQYVHEHGGWVLRYFIDKEGGITLDDCALISDQMGRILDASDVIPQTYSLEVSSPGLNRPLKTEKDFLRFIGQRVDITLYAPVNGRRHFRGDIQGFENGIARIEDSEKNIHTLPLTDIAKAKLDPEIDF